MKSKRLPQASHPKHGRAAATAAAAVLLCLAGLRLTGPASSAAAAGQAQSGTAAAAPQNSPVPVPPGSTVSTTTATTTTVTTPTPTPTPVAGERVKLYYLREGTKIAAALNGIAADKDSVIAGLGVGVIAEDEIVLFGSEDRRKLAKRLVATLDLPRPGIQMEMWGVQMSSREPDDLAEVMRRAREEIDETQRAVRKTFFAMQELARGVPAEGRAMDTRFDTILTGHLFYKSALDAHRQLSLSDILLRLIAAQEPQAETRWLANQLDRWLEAGQGKYLNAYAKGEDAPGHESKGRKRGAAAATQRAACDRKVIPFGRFFESRGLTYRCGNDAGSRWEISQEPGAAENALISKAALLNFALHYGRLVHDPDNFDAYYLQQSAGTLNGRLQAAIDALNQDVRDLFVAPTLDRIRGIVADFQDVEYAQVGRTTVASLSGTPTVVSSKAVNTFESMKPLTLTDFLAAAKGITDSTTPFVPNAAKTNMLGTIPFAEVLGLVGALGQDRSVWRELNSGVSFTITPSVLRNMSSAELNVVLETGDPVASGTVQSGPGVRPLTRVSQHNVTTKVYVNALDFFDLSDFGSQATLAGGRGYVPIIGPFWRGLFGDAPVIGELLSWKKPPKTVYSQSLVLTTSFITPTAMGVALLLPTGLPDGSDKVIYRKCFNRMQTEVDDYAKLLFNPRSLNDANTSQNSSQTCVDDARAKAALRAEADGLKAEAAGLKEEGETLKEMDATRKEIEERRREVEAARRARDAARGAAAPTPTP